ncbi:SAM-dependent methyltransferase [Sphaerimonospora cavernae]|uniref:SAM-dependent methyltransferase n=1 Tax=Sphaerimonospora cavernae TaxID=1740611 RepID=A0ABV6U289_9ACTN
MSDERAVPELNTSVPHPARMYDYYLGGKDNFAADREAAEKVVAAAGGGIEAARLIVGENRKFLTRAVRMLVESGIEQFLDLGTGIPTSPNVHETAQQVNPKVRVVYVDNDPIVLVHARALMASGDAGKTTIAQADVREPEKILGHPEVLGTLDLDRPMAIMLVAVLHFLRDSDDPYGVVARLLAAAPAGSYLVISHVTQDFDPEAASRGAQVYDKATAPMVARTRDEVVRFFDGLELLDPGVVQVSHWRPDGPVPYFPNNAPWVWGGVARKPE